MHVIVWEFRARRGREKRFEKVYGPDGDWAALFERSGGYLGTELLRDRGISRRYLVLDRWTSREAFQAFKQKHRADYEALDRRCESLTEHEAPLGDYSATPRLGARGGAG